MRNKYQNLMSRVQNFVSSVTSGPFRSDTCICYLFYLFDADFKSSNQLYSKSTIVAVWLQSKVTFFVYLAVRKGKLNAF